MRHPLKLRASCRLLFALALLASASSAHAARIAPRLGLNMSTLGFDDDARLLHFEQLLEGSIQLDNLTRFGMAVGVDVSWLLGSRVSIGTGASISMQGGSLRGDELLRVAEAPNVAVRTMVEMDYELAYLNVPLTVRLSQPWSAGNAYVAGGPLLGILVHDRVTQSIQTAAVDLVFDPVQEPDVPGATFSILLAAGVELPLQRGNGFLEVSFTQGLSTAIQTTVPDATVRQRVVGVATGIRY